MRNMFGSFVKTAATGYGTVGVMQTRMTLVRYTSGQYGFIRADGTSAPIPFIPESFRTSGDVVSVLATMHADYGMYGTADIPATLPAHGWKVSMDLPTFIRHMAGDKLETAIAQLEGDEPFAA